MCGGCAQTVHNPVDLQLDIAAELPETADQVRICVDDGPARTFGAASGRYALTGLAADEWPTITTDVLSDGFVIARATATFDGEYATTELSACDACDVCIGGGSPAPQEAAWVLGLRFL